MQIWILTDRRYSQQRMPHALTQHLVGRKHRVCVVVADDGWQVSSLAADGPNASVWAALDLGDLVVARSRHPFALALLEEAESRGARTAITSAAVRRVRDKVRATLTLEARGLPTPETFLACNPGDLVRLRPRFPLVLKPFQGDNAQGIRFVRTSRELADVAWAEPIVIAQHYVDSGGVDLKLYVAGEQIWAVRRPSPLSGGAGAPERVSVDPALARLARDCAGAFELPLLGVDVIEGADGPLIVDVNEFPNYTGIDEAPEAIERVLIAHARKRPVGALLA